MACHYLDGFVLMAVAVLLLDRILLPDRAPARPDGAPPTGARVSDPAVPVLASDAR